MKLDNRTHSRNLPLLTNTCDFHVAMLCQFAYFTPSCLNSENVCIYLVTKMLPESQSTLAHNSRNILHYIQNAYTSIDSLLCNKTDLRMQWETIGEISVMTKIVWQLK